MVKNWILLLAGLNLACTNSSVKTTAKTPDAAETPADSTTVNAGKQEDLENETLSGGNSDNSKDAANEVDSPDGDTDSTIALTVNGGDTHSLSTNSQLQASFTGNNLTIEWQQVSGPGTVTFSDVNATTPSIQCSVDGTYVVRVDASDPQGNTAYDQVTIVWDTTKPTVDAGNDLNVNGSGNLSANANDVLSGLASYAWSQVSGPGTVSFGSSNTAATSFSVTQDGTYVVQVLVTDAAGNFETDTLTIHSLVQTMFTYLHNDNSAGEFGGGVKSVGLTWANSALQKQAVSTAAERELQMSGDAGLSLTGLLGYWRFNGSAGVLANAASLADSSSNGNHLTVVNGDATGVTLENGIYAQGLRSFGNDEPDRVYLAESSDFDFGANDFSLALWVKLNEDPGANEFHQILENWQDGINSGYGLEVQQDSHLYFYLWSMGSWVDIDTEYPLVVGEWYQVVAVREGNKLYLYVNGRLDSAKTVGSVDVSVAGAGLHFASSQYTGSAFAWGKFNLDDVSIWNRPLSASEANHLYQRRSSDYIALVPHFTSSIIQCSNAESASFHTLSWVPSYPYGREIPNGSAAETGYTSGGVSSNMAAKNIGLWRLNGTLNANVSAAAAAILDAGPKGNHGTLDSGAVAVPTYGSGHFNQSMAFSGTDQELIDFGAGSDFDLVTSGKYTWSFWINPNDTTLQFQTVWAQVTANGSHGIYFMAHTTGNGDFGPVRNGVSVALVSNGNISGWHSNDDVLANNRWHHMVVTYDGSQSFSARIQIYVNGTNVTTGDVMGASFTEETMNMAHATLGGNVLNANENFRGRIDEVAIFSDLLSSNEISGLYMRGADIQLQVRSCEQSNCSDGGNFVGPAASPSAHYSNANSSSLTTPEFTLTGLNASKYLQYRATLSSYETKDQISLGSVSVQCEIP
jgi:hypothetical protein